MTMDLTNVRPGIANTVMGSMGTFDQQAAMAADPAVYLPRVADNILTPLSSTAPTVVTAPADADSASGNFALTQQQLSELSLTVMPGSLVDANGNPVANPEVGISPVPPQIVQDMLPAGLLQHSFDITIQAPGGAIFTQPATLTAPNVFGLAPGEKTYVLSFDHTTGRLVISGTATVSADGQTITTNPGSGVTQPGWHGFTPAGSQGTSGSAPSAATPRTDCGPYPDAFVAGGGAGLEAGKNFLEAVKSFLGLVGPELAENPKLGPFSKFKDAYDFGKDVLRLANTNLDQVSNDLNAAQQAWLNCIRMGGTAGPSSNLSMNMASLSTMDPTDSEVSADFAAAFNAIQTAEVAINNESSTRDRIDQEVSALQPYGQDLSAIQALLRISPGSPGGLPLDQYQIVLSHFNALNSDVALLTELLTGSPSLTLLATQVFKTLTTALNAAGASIFIPYEPDRSTYPWPRTLCSPRITRWLD
jgi:hypothetical protein